MPNSFSYIKYELTKILFHSIEQVKNRLLHYKYIVFIIKCFKLGYGISYYKLSISERRACMKL